MTTLRQPAFVSMASKLAMALGLAACVNAGSGPTPGAISSAIPPYTIRFDNNARDNVDVYLIGEKREWHLGRVAIGAIENLRLPDEALAQGSMLRLAVVVGERLTLDAARDPRAVLTIRQTAASILSRRWGFSQGWTQGYLTSLPH